MLLYILIATLLILSCHSRILSREDELELFNLIKVCGHVCSEHHVYHHVTNLSVLFCSQTAENVALVLG